MVKRIGVLIGISIMVMGCVASEPYYIDTDARTLGVTSVVLISEMDRKTKTLVEQALDVKASLGKVMIDMAIIESINGTRGPKSMSNFPQIYNNPVNASFEIHLIPGIHTVVVAPNYHLTEIEDRVALELDLVAGHRYFVGAVVAVMRKPLFFNIGGDYRWRPVVVDLTDMRVVLPVQP